jgi:hypothetical protein
VNPERNRRGGNQPPAKTSTITTAQRERAELVAVMSPSEQRQADKIIESVRQGKSWEEACLTAQLEWEKFLNWLERGGKPSPGPYRDFVIQLHESGQCATESHLWRFKTAFPAEVISHED